MLRAQGQVAKLDTKPRDYGALALYHLLVLVGLAVLGKQDRKLACSHPRASSARSSVFTN